MRYGSAVVLAAVTLTVGLVSEADAALDEAARCRIARYKAAAKYLECQSKALYRDVSESTLVIGGMSLLYQKVAARCRTKYVNTRARWPFTFSSSGSVCGGDRFVDNGDGTITDILTALVWEVKTDGGGIHDKDDRYTWSASGTTADGTVFTTFLAALNTSPCFAGACDWRLPTMAELQTILDPLVPCGPCVDPNLGMFAPDITVTGTPDPDLPELLREVSFAAGGLNNAAKTGSFAVRAVRGGL